METGIRESLEFLGIIGIIVVSISGAVILGFNMSDKLRARGLTPA